MTNDNRYTYVRRHTYRTRSNRLVATKTPGGKVVGHLLKKHATGVKCGDCGGRINGIPAIRPYAKKSTSKRELRVNRAYGGNSCAKCVRNRIVRAFLEEEKKTVKKMLQEKTKKA